MDLEKWVLPGQSIAYQPRQLYSVAMENWATFAEEHSRSDSSFGDNDSSHHARSSQEFEEYKHESEGEEQSLKEEDRSTEDTKVPEYERLQ